MAGVGANDGFVFAPTQAIKNTQNKKKTTPKIFQIYKFNVWPLRKRTFNHYWFLQKRMGVASKLLRASCSKCGCRFLMACVGANEGDHRLSPLAPGANARMKMERFINRPKTHLQLLLALL